MIVNISVIVFFFQIDFDLLKRFDCFTLFMEEIVLSQKGNKLMGLLLYLPSS